MTTYPEADRIREENYARILAENVRLRAEVDALVGTTLTQQQSLQMLDRVCCGRVW